MPSASRVIGNVRSHDTLRRILGSYPAGRVLDIPSGEGALSQFLIDQGWDVNCADIDPGLFRLDNVPFTRVDLNRRLPFDDESFDVVICANGIHRLYNPGGAIREFKRILKPGGRLFINTNNYASTYHRVRFLLYGSLDNYVNSQSVGQSVSDPEAHVRNAIMLPQIFSVMETEKLTITGVHPAAIQKRQRLLAPLAVVLKALSYLLPQKRSNYVKWTSSYPVMFGHYVLIEAKKDE